MADKIWIGATTAWGTATNWSPAGVPIAGDNVRIPATSTQAIAGSNQSAVALGYVIVEDGYTQTIGTVPTSSAGATYLQINCTRFEFAGSGESYIDIGTSAISPQIFNTAGAGTGQNGLYLKGSAISILSIMAGNVGLAALPFETATVTTVRLVGGSVTVGSGTTITNLHGLDGDSLLLAACTTVIINGGTFRSRETGAITTLTVNAGEAFPESTGTITTLTIDGGSVDMTGSGAARTVTTTNWKRGNFNFPGQAITFTNAPTLPTDRNVSGSITV